MEWQRFRDEDPCWLRIAGLIDDRLRMVELELSDPQSTPDLVAVRRLQQEQKDLLFFKSLPDLFIKFPEPDPAIKDPDDGMDSAV